MAPTLLISNVNTRADSSSESLDSINGLSFFRDIETNQEITHNTICRLQNRFSKYLDLRFPVINPLREKYARLLKIQLTSKNEQSLKDSINELEKYGLLEVTLSPKSIIESFNSADISISATGSQITNVFNIFINETDSQGHFNRDVDFFLSATLDETADLVKETQRVLKKLIKKKLVEKYQNNNSSNILGNISLGEHEFYYMNNVIKLEDMFIKKPIKFISKPNAGDHFYLFKLGDIDIGVGYSQRPYRFAHEFRYAGLKGDVSPYEGTRDEAFDLAKKKVLNTKVRDNLNPYMLIKYWEYIAQGWIASDSDLLRVLYQNLEIRFKDDQVYVEKFLEDYFKKKGIYEADGYIEKLSLLFTVYADLSCQIEDARLNEIMIGKIETALSIMAQIEPKASELIDAFLSGIFNDDEYSFLYRYANDNVLLSVYSKDNTHIKFSFTLNQFSELRPFIQKVLNYKNQLSKKIAYELLSNQWLSSADIPNFYWMEVIRSQDDEVLAFYKLLPCYTKLDSPDSRVIDENIAYLLAYVQAIENNNKQYRHEHYEALLNIVDEYSECTSLILDLKSALSKRNGRQKCLQWMRRVSDRLKNDDRSIHLDHHSALSVPAWVEKIFPEQYSIKPSVNETSISSQEILGERKQHNKRPTNRKKGVFRRKRLNKRVIEPSIENTRKNNELLAQRLNQSEKKAVESIWQHFLFFNMPVKLVLLTAFLIKIIARKYSDKQVVAIEKNRFSLDASFPRLIINWQEIFSENLTDNNINTFFSCYPYENLNPSFTQKVGRVDKEVEWMVKINRILKQYPIEPDIAKKMKLVFLGVMPGCIIDFEKDSKNYILIQRAIGAINHKLNLKYEFGEVVRLRNKSWSGLVDLEKLSRYFKSIQRVPATHKIQHINHVKLIKDPSDPVPDLVENIFLIEGMNIFDSRMFVAEWLWRNFSALFLTPAVFYEAYVGEQYSKQFFLDFNATHFDNIGYQNSKVSLTTVPYAAIDNYVNYRKLFPVQAYHSSQIFMSATRAEKELFLHGLNKAAAAIKSEDFSRDFPLKMLDLLSIQAHRFELKKMKSDYQSLLAIDPSDFYTVQGEVRARSLAKILAWMK